MLLHRATRFAERQLGLRLLRPLRALVMDQRALAERQLRKMDRETLRRQRALYETLGMLPPGFDLENELGELLAEQVLALYDAEEGLMILGEQAAGQAEATAALPLRAVLAHEAVHALQDQHFGLLARLREAEARSADAASALHAVVEGEAMLVTLAVALGERGLRVPREVLVRVAAERMDELVRQWLERPWSETADTMDLGGQNKVLDRVPPLLRAPLVFAYLGGLVHVARRLRERGGRPLADPPGCTLAVRRTTSCPPPLRLPAPPPPSGWSPLGEETLGWLESGIFLAASLPRDVVDLPWRGDRLRLYRGPGEAHAVLWRLRFEGAGAAEQAERLARAALRGREAVAHRAGAELWLAVGWPSEAGRGILAAAVQAAGGAR